MSEPVATQKTRWLARWAAHDGARRLAWFVAAAACALAWESWLLFWPQIVTVKGARPELVTALGEGRQVSQTFVAPGDGLESVTLWFRAPERPVAAEIEYALLADVKGTYVPLVKWSKRIDVTGVGAQSFEFSPVRASRGRMYRFDVKLLRPLEWPLGVEAYADDAARPGRLLIDGRERWGDLAYRVRTVSRYRSFLASAKGLPDYFRTTPLPLVLLALYNWAIVAFVYYMTVADDDMQRRKPGRREERVQP
jgi:hypothetical protein